MNAAEEQYVAVLVAELRTLDRGDPLWVRPQVAETTWAAYLDLGDCSDERLGVLVRMAHRKVRAPRTSA